MLYRELVEQVLEVHAGGYVPSLPQEIHHFAPPANFRVTVRVACSCDDVSRETKEDWCVRHGTLHKTWQEFIGIDHRQLTTILCGLHIHALGLESGTKGIPMRTRGNENNALAIFECSRGKPTDRAI